MAEVPEDVREFLKELERRRLEFTSVAVERTPMPHDTYDVWVRRREGVYEYVGLRPADEVYKEKDHVVCGKLTCTLFQRDVIRLAFSRETRKVHEPVEL
jgi:hypothetical protein